MTKAQTKETGTDVALADDKTTAVTASGGAGGSVPAFLADKAAADAGKGTSQDVADNLVPLIYLLQALSPQVQKRNPEYIEGAEEGDIWLRNSGLPPIKGDDGILFQPCVFQKDWVEWMPNRGGYAGRHDTMPTDAVEAEIDDGAGGTKKVWQLPNKNIVVETRYHIGFVHLPDGSKMPYVIPLSGSGHTVSRGWMARMNSKSIPGVEGPAPSWACLYQLKAKGKNNAKGQSWVIFDVIDAGWVQSAEDYERGARLFAQFQSGEKGIEQPVDETAHGGSGGAASGGDAGDNNAAM